jgi:hypothetical protein
MRAPVATAVAIAIGLVILLGYFFPITALSNVRDVLLGWAVSLAGVAVLVGILNLLGVHLRRLTAPQNRDYYSLILIVAFLVTAGAGFILGPLHPQFIKVVTNIQMPIEAALMGLLAVSLAYACLRLYQRRKGWMTVVFILSAVVFLLVGSSYLAIGNSIPAVKSFVDLLTQFQIAGSRGILLGIALGSLLTGLRIILGADRPYSG